METLKIIVKMLLKALWIGATLTGLVAYFTFCPDVLGQWFLVLAPLVISIAVAFVIAVIIISFEEM